MYYTLWEAEKNIDLAMLPDSLVWFGSELRAPRKSINLILLLIPVALLLSPNKQESDKSPAKVEWLNKMRNSLRNIKNVTAPT